MERPRLGLLRHRLAKRNAFPCGVVSQLPVLVELSRTVTVVIPFPGIKEGKGMGRICATLSSLTTLQP